MTNREELHLLAGAYALDALEPQEREEFEAYLLSSEDARAEVAALTDTAVILGLASKPEAPPAGLKDRLMAQIAVTPQVVTPQLPSAATSEVQSAPRLQAVDVPARAPQTGLVSRTDAKVAARWYSRPVTYLVAAAAAVAIFFGGAAFNASQAPAPQALSASYVQLTSASDVQRTTAKVAGGGSATLIWSLQLRRSAVVINKLPMLSDGKTYELWYIGGSGPIAAGTFSAANAGATVRVLEGQMSGGDTIGITVEPSGGSKTPTTKPIVAIASV